MRATGRSGARALCSTHSGYCTGLLNITCLLHAAGQLSHADSCWGNSGWVLAALLLQGRVSQQGLPSGGLAIPHHLITGLWAVATAAAWPAKDHREAITHISTDLEWETADVSEATHGLYCLLKAEFYTRSLCGRGPTGQQSASKRTPCCL